MGTEYEQLIGQLLDAEGDPGEESQPTLGSIPARWSDCLGRKQKVVTVCS